MGHRTGRNPRQPLAALTGSIIYARSVRRRGTVPPQGGHYAEHFQQPDQADLRPVLHQPAIGAAVNRDTRHAVPRRQRSRSYASRSRALHMCYCMCIFDHRVQILLDEGRYQ